MRIVLAILLLAAAPASALAQRADSLLHHADRQNWYVRVTDPAGRIAEGRNLRFIRDSVELAGLRFDLSDSLRIERRLRGKSGALSGGVFAGTTLGLLGWAFATGMCEYNCGDGALYAVAAGSLAGFALGSAFGALVSPGDVEWRQELPPPSVANAAADNITKSPPMSGRGMVLLAGLGLIAEDDDAGSYPVARLSLQVSAASGSTGANEFAIESNALLIPDGGLLFGLNAGPNFVTATGGFYGAAIGVATGGGGLVFNVGIRGGKRPLRRSGLRTELRGDYYNWSGNHALAATVSLGLQTH